MPKILVVDDELPIRELVKYNLEREGFQVLLAEEGNSGVELARKETPDLIVLDIMLPGQDGLAVCRALHQEEVTRSIPIIMLSARGEELDKVLGLEMGADDYMTKPFSPRELIARIKARLRRNTGDTTVTEESGRIAVGKLVIDQDRFMVSVNGVKQDLTPKEFELLRYLARHPGKVFTRDFLLEQIWGYDFAGDSRTVDVHIRHIRQKLEQIAGAPQFIETVRGVGYRFKEA
ncbi:response regulator transcription factor [Desulforamulus ruminis]|uniref:Stage 0 sporulation protein A homolog n=1 Tax=Desulforamulus ruminis (strain ATCC 23193 / DSM 2154 / NCIMB 8452 / DL) TaxID=696281 RepID=F6DKA1_DESRL|nr:response regulator transcription factor [Desulforamulus ruminis]AEG61518.1 response regulator receiver [Desulforamulus ruminis DSM 2154]